MFINYLLRFFQIFAMGEGVIPPHGSLAQRQSAESRPLLRLEGAGSSPARPVFCTLIIEYWWLEWYNFPITEKGKYHERNGDFKSSFKRWIFG